MSFAQNGPGNFARGWKYNLYTAVAMMYEIESETLNAMTLGYDKPFATTANGMIAIDKQLSHHMRGFVERFTSSRLIRIPAICTKSGQDQGVTWLPRHNILATIPIL